MAEGGISRAQEAEREEMARIRESKRAAEERQYLAFEQARLFLESTNNLLLRADALAVDISTLCRLHDVLSNVCATVLASELSIDRPLFEEQMMREGLEARQRAKQLTEGGHGNVSAFSSRVGGDLHIFPILKSIPTVSALRI